MQRRWLPFILNGAGFSALIVTSTGGCSPIACDETVTCPPPPGECVIHPDPARPMYSTFGPCQQDSGVDASIDVADVDASADTTQEPNTSDGHSDAGVEAETASPCDPTKSPSEAPNVIDERCGIFVSSAAADAGANGSRTNPYATIAAGLTRAKADRKRVYVCDDGTGFAESIVIDPAFDGIQIFGGFDCVTWAYDASRRAVIRAPSSPALRISALTTAALIENVELDAPDGTNPGDSSIAAIVDTSANVVLRRVKAVAGKGKDGANGVPASGAAMSGAPGNAGHDACSTDPNPGGATAISICDGAPVSAGGKGGDGANGPPAIVAGGPGIDGTPPTDASVGKGGQGEPISGSWSCANGVGQPGDNGADGSSGAGGTGPGILTSSGWIGTRGGDGEPGTPGQGGGGGGGARAPLMCPANDAGVTPSTPIGASGGSGGGGGCGGKGGQGGGAGGSSIAVISIQSSLTLDACDLVASDAGKGGDGAQGQKGGDPGLSGQGGRGSSSPPSNNACPGGLGGQGGNGGPGGGGAGGHSLGVAYAGAAPGGLATSTIIHAPAGGAGGAPGSGGDPTGKGIDGSAADALAF